MKCHGIGHDSWGIVANETHVQKKDEILNSDDNKLATEKLQKQKKKSTLFEETKEGATNDPEEK